MEPASALPIVRSHDLVRTDRVVSRADAGGLPQRAAGRAADTFVHQGEVLFRESGRGDPFGETYGPGTGRQQARGAPQPPPARGQTLRAGIEAYLANGGPPTAALRDPVYLVDYFV